MARPVSRYFTPVIKKILDAKKAETILIDEGFKLKLRQDLLNKIALDPKPFVAEKVPFFTSLGNWRYVLAIVPSALLVTVVVTQIMKMPLSMRSKEVSVPVVHEDQSASNKKVNFFEDNGSPEAASPEPDKASSVMESNAKKVSADPAQEVTVSPAVPQNDSPQPTVPINDTASLEASPQDISSDNLTRVQNMETTSSPSEEGTNSDMVLRDAKISEPAEQNVVPATSTEGPLPPPSLEAPVLQTTPSSGATLLPLQDTLKVIPPPAPTVPFYYSVNLSAEDKNSLEQNVIYPLIKNKSVLFVNIKPGSGSLIMVEVFYSDGTQNSFYYQKNNLTGAWDNVQFVQKLYNDGSFSYQLR